MNVSITAIDSKKVWEGAISEIAPHSYFQGWTWGEINRNLGNKVWRLGLYENKSCIGVAQLVKISARRGTFIHIRHGPVLNKHDVPTWRYFLKEASQIAKIERAWFIRLSPLIDEKGLPEETRRSLGLRPSPIHALDAERCWVLDIRKPEEELIAGMRKTTRYEIRKALKLPIDVRRSFDGSLLPVFMDLYGKTARRQGFVPHADITKEVEYFSKENKTLILVGYFERQPISAAIIVFYGDQAIYRHGASVHSSVPVSYLLQWEAIREAKKRSLSVYNFWGISHPEDKKHKWAGLTLFKMGFGGRELSYMHAQDFPLSPKYYITFAIENMRKALQGY